MKKPCDKTVSGEALSQKRFEEEIRKHAKEPFVAKASPKLLQWFRNFIEGLDLENVCQYDDDDLKDWREMQVDFFKQELNSVLGVVAKTEAERTKKLEEPYAKLAHQIWSEFIDYCLRIGAANGPEIQRKSIWERWHNLARTPYEKLSHIEQDSDRSIARRYLQFLSEGSFRKKKVLGQQQEQKT